MKKFYWALTLFIFSCIVILFGIFNSQYFVLILGVVGCIIALVKVVKGVVEPSEEMFVPVCQSKDLDVIYLSFDDGPDPQVTPRVLDVLKKYNIKAIFFLIGHKVEKHPDLVKRIVNEGHLIGNHSFSHALNITYSSKKKVVQEIEKAGQIIKDISGREAIFYRPPFGIINPNIGSAIRKTKLKALGWNFRSYDTNASIADQLFKRIQYKKVGGIVLFHDHLSFIPEFLEQFVEDQLAKNNKFGNIETLLEGFQSTTTK